MQKTSKLTKTIVDVLNLLKIRAKKDNKKIKIHSAKIMKNIPLTVGGNRQNEQFAILTQEIKKVQQEANAIIVNTHKERGDVKSISKQYLKQAKEVVN